MLNSEKNKNGIIASFPNLKNDEDFEIIDGHNPNYNCIAYAANVTDTWWEPIPIHLRPLSMLDGVKIDWPFNANADSSLETLIKIFNRLGYEDSNNYEFEKGFKKIAFYEKNGMIVHAARQLTHGKREGIWSSKLGKSFLILHSSPQSINSSVYGKAIYFMKKNMLT